MAQTLDVTVNAHGSPAPYVNLCVESSSGQCVFAVTDEKGRAHFSDLAELNGALSIKVVPIGLGCWRTETQAAASGLIEIKCPPIVNRGPLGWWHRAIGIASVDYDRGKGIRVGIADRNFEPGEGLEGLSIVELPGISKAAPEELSHGELVARLVGNRASRQNLFLGVSPGVEIVFVPLRPGPDGKGVMLRDLSPAIFQLVRSGVDIINLSLGNERSFPEMERVVGRARRSGILCIAAAGNEGRDPVSFPARYSSCVSVGAVGMAGIAPPGSLVQQEERLRRDPPRAGAWKDYYIPRDCNFGDKLDVTAPGVGIVVSTPSIDPFDMSGTSFAAPIAAGALAVGLFEDQRFLTMSRDERRCDYMMNRLREMTQDLGMPVALQGCGLVQL